MSEYGDPLSGEEIGRAVQMALDLHRKARNRSLDANTREAVTETICACVPGIADDLEHHLSGIHAAAEVRSEQSSDGFAISHIELATEGEIPGLDANAFLAQAETAKRSCPISKALSGVEISVTARLLDHSTSTLLRADAANAGSHADVMSRK